MNHETSIPAPALPYDVARCPGAAAKQCENCLRRTAPGRPGGPQPQLAVPAQAFAKVACPYRLEQPS